MFNETKVFKTLTIVLTWTTSRRRRPK